MGKRNKTIVTGAIPVVAMAVLLNSSYVPGLGDVSVPYAAEGPGPTFNTLGQHDGRDIVTITGTTTYPTDGHLNMTTVSVRHGMTLPQLLTRWGVDGDTIVPIEQIFPPNQSPSDVQEQNMQAFSSAEDNATTAAYSYLRRPLAAAVVNTEKGSPADGKLLPGDIITAVGDTAVVSPHSVVDQVKKLKPGQDVTFEVIRGTHRETLTIRTKESPKDPKVAFLGVVMKAAPADGAKIDFNLHDIGGPSAGLMFSLAIVDKLTKEQLTGGAFIAGTGTIDNSGAVGPIGGITHKIAAARDAGATIFLTPKDNCAEALRDRPDGIELISVDSLSDAVTQLNSSREGKKVTTCQ